MSKNLGGLPVIYAEKPSICELCGKYAETRPYGPHGARICFECGMKDKKATGRMCKRILFGERI